MPNDTGPAVKPPKMAKVERCYLHRHIDALEAPKAPENEVLWRADFSTPAGRAAVTTPKSPSSRTQSRNR